MKKCNLQDITLICNTLNSNGIIAIPTDTIYGIATTINNYKKIVEVKKRENKPLAFLCSSIEEMMEIIEIDSKHINTLKKFTPGAFTIVGKTANKKYAINGDITTTGVRIPNHPSLLKLLQTTGPLVVSSANISGTNETYLIEEVYQVFNEQLDLYVENDLLLSKQASAVIDINTFQIYRNGDNDLQFIKALKKD